MTISWAYGVLKVWSVAECASFLDKSIASLKGLRRQCALYLKSIGLSTKSRAVISSRIG